MWMTLHCGVKYGWTLVGVYHLVQYLLISVSIQLNYSRIKFHSEATIEPLLLEIFCLPQMSYQIKLFVKFRGFLPGQPQPFKLNFHGASGLEFK